MERSKCYKLKLPLSQDLTVRSDGEKTMKIGTLAAHAGVNASAVRYYESVGLLEPPLRVRGQRRYSEDAVYRLLLIGYASSMGFTLGEIKIFLAGLRHSAPVGPRWKKLARRKIKEVERTIERSLRLKSLLQHLLRCRCASLQVCVERLSLSQNLQQLSADAVEKTRRRV